MFKYIFILCLVRFGITLKRGDVCPISGQSGICKSLDECEYAKKIVNENEWKPQLCGLEGRKRIEIVCCPQTDNYPDTGPLRKYFQATNDGVMRSRDTVCRYDGTVPMTCCKNVDDQQIDSRYVEPSTCPKLQEVSVDRSTLTRAESIALAKCEGYRQYSDKCVGSDDDYYRNNTCEVFVERISGGREALPKEFPHMAVIGCLNGIPNEDAEIVWVGGGSLISEKFILTAGHALFDLLHKRVKFALLGALNKRNIRDGELYNIVRRIPHDNYNSVSKINDIALLELDRRVRLSEYIRPACLPISGIAVKPDFLLAGWGETIEKGNTSDVLMTIDGVAKREDLCKARFQQKTFKWNSKTMLCVAGSIKSADTCKGDSGGPLMARAEDEALKCTYFVQGIVSFGPECGLGAPGVYTNVKPFLDWIVRTVWPMEYRNYK